MTRHTATAGLVPPWTLAVGAMLSVLGSALSVPLIDVVGRRDRLAAAGPQGRWCSPRSPARRMTATAFGTLMALVLLLGLLLGLLVLAQRPSPVQLAGIVLVAGAGARRGGRRTATSDTPQDEVLLPLTATEPT